MTISEIQAGMGLVPPNPDQRKVDIRDIEAISERSDHLKTKTGREGNSHPMFLQPESKGQEVVMFELFSREEAVEQVKQGTFEANNVDPVFSHMFDKGVVGVAKNLCEGSFHLVFDEDMQK